MKIQIASDLHLEFPENREWLKDNPLIPNGDILLLAGDIISDKYKKKAKPFYEKISKDFPFIISTLGNHEFYKGEVEYAYPFYKSKISENHIRLNNQSIIIGNVKFIVSTMWSHVPLSQSAIIANGMNDYRLIYRKNIHNDKLPVQVTDTNNFHQLSIKFIREELEKPFDGKTLVMTHHIPSYKCLTNRPANPELRSGYASNNEDLIKAHPQIKYWITGHAHNFNITTIGKTQIIRNPLGYLLLYEESDFKRGVEVEI
jgi:predicted phosphodiesterase